MILYEYEGKKLLSEAGIAVSKSQLLESPNQQITLKMPLVLKAQVLSGKRAKAGGIVKIDLQDDIKSKLVALFSKTINGEKVEKVLVEELVSFEKEDYLSISYDTDYRLPVLAFSENGGIGIEQRQSQVFPINPLDPCTNLPQNVDSDLLKRLINLFFDADCLLLEINPLVKAKDGKFIALDAKIKLDDEAMSRHKDWSFAPRGVPGKTPTKNEIEAKKIDEDDYRGVAGSTYFDLDGDIAVLSSGGGVSLTAMDALIKSGGRPANFTEYSGNPPKEKVTKLTRIVLSKPNIHGLWVIGTVAANFTDIYETLSGFIEGLRQAQTELNTKFKFPIVIRRGGPREEEAFEMLRQVEGFDLTLQSEETSIAQSAKVIAEKAKKYAASS